MARHQLYRELQSVCEPLLTSREHDVLSRYYDNGDTLRVIGNAYGVSSNRIAQIRNKALRKLCRVLYVYLLDE